jgi:hypothetical protein
LFTTTSVLTLNAWSNFSSLCDTLRPPSPLPSLSANDTDGYCPVGPGEFTFSTTIPWGDNRPLTTLTTRISAVDPLTQELICIDVDTTPLDPRPDNPYGQAIAIFWATVALAIAYWLLVGFARIVSAWDRGITSKGKGVWARAQSAGFILASAISGERLATSPALLRFCELLYFFIILGIVSCMLSSHAFDEGYYIPYAVVCCSVHGGCSMAYFCL